MQTCNFAKWESSTVLRQWFRRTERWLYEAEPECSLNEMPLLGENQPVADGGRYE
jgi:hypothetical protein